MIIQKMEMESRLDGTARTSNFILSMWNKRTGEEPEEKGMIEESG